MKRNRFRFSLLQPHVASIVVSAVVLGTMIASPLLVQAQVATQHVGTAPGVLPLATTKIAAPNLQARLNGTNYDEVLASGRYNRSSSATLTTYWLDSPDLAIQYDSVELMSVFLDGLSSANTAEINGTSSILLSRLSETSATDLSRFFRFIIGDSKDPVSAGFRDYLKKVNDSPKGTLWLYVKPRLAVSAEDGTPLGMVETETGKFRAMAANQPFHMQKPSHKIGSIHDFPDATVQLSTKTYDIGTLATLFSTPEKNVITSAAVQGNKIFLTAGQWKLSEFLQALQQCLSIDAKDLQGDLYLTPSNGLETAKWYDAMKKRVDPAINIILASFKDSIASEKFKSRSKAFQKFFAGDMTERISISSPDFPQGLPIDYSKAGTYAQPMLELFVAPTVESSFNQNFLNAIFVIRPQ